jgi:pimeloyl-ACP methyl ester carboxylesterase
VKALYFVREVALGALGVKDAMDPITMNRQRQHHYTRIEGVRIHWVEMAPAAGEAAACDAATKPPLVLLHGLNDCYRTWRLAAPLLARDRRVLMPDLPGHGLSERPDASYELHWYAHLMGRWLEEAGVETCDLAGHSFGGGVAQAMLLQCPERIRRLALVASGGLGREVGWLLRLASIPGIVERFGQPFMGPCTRLTLRAVGNLLGREDVDRLTSINAQSGSARAFARTVRDVIDWRGQRRTFFERAKELRRLPPIAIFWGDRDGIIPVAHVKAMSAEVEGVHATLFDGCGHYPHHQHTQAFAGGLLRFLDDPTVAPARLRATPPDSSPALDPESRPSLVALGSTFAAS